MDYQDFSKRFEASGLTQREFGEQEGISASMVSYYLRRSKKQSVSSGFTPIKVEQTPTQKFIIITTKGGTEIRIPA